MTPPPLPPDVVYTSCYCEENIYLLAKTFCAQAEQPTVHDWSSKWDVYVVFISNDSKTVALWNQKSRKDVVVWDYHVILVLRPRDASDNFSSSGEIPEIEAWTYDFDTRLPIPCSWKDYMLGTFPYVLSASYELPKQYVSSFRVVPARVYLDSFASDRSHMLIPSAECDTIYLSPPPAYPPICGKIARERDIANNLMASFVTMRPRRIQTRQMEEGQQPAAENTSESYFQVDDIYGEVLDLSGFLRWFGGL